MSARSDFQLDNIKLLGLLYLTETCRQIFPETSLLLFRLNEFRIDSAFNFGCFVGSLSLEQVDIIRTYVWPRRCDLTTHCMLSQLTGLQRIFMTKTGLSRGDFYIPENATLRVQEQYNEKR